MHLTVAICTWNRAALLDQTLDRMRQLALPAGVTWELLVVDNNCTDDTSGMVAKYESVLPVRRILEPKQGHSNARNCAIEHATGEYLIWTDDDVLVEPDWLASYAAAFRMWPTAGYFGGRIEPWFEGEPPAWVRRHLKLLEGPLVIRDFGPDVRPFREGEEAFGANLAFRTSLLREVRFDPNRGRVGTGVVGADETTVVDRLRTDGQYGVWVGTARVRHYIPTARMTTRYVWEYFHGYGRLTERVAPSDPIHPSLFGRPRWLIRRYLNYRARSLLLSAGRGTGWLDAFIRAAVNRGILDEYKSANRVVAGVG